MSTVPVSINKLEYTPVAFTPASPPPPRFLYRGAVALCRGDNCPEISRSKRLALMNELVATKAL